jgi:protein gp37
MTKIEWTEATWNPIVGCSIVSPGCTNCYAMRMAARLEAIGPRPDGSGNVGLMHYAGTTQNRRGKPTWTGKVAMAADAVLTAPLRRRKPTTYFVNSMGDLFHEGVPDEWIDRVFAVMALAPQHTFQVLTKRASRMREYMARRSGRHHPAMVFATCLSATGTVAHPSIDLTAWPLPNVWLGVSAEDQRRAYERIPELLATPAAVRFVSAEPLIGPIYFDPLWLRASPSAMAASGRLPANAPAWTRIGSTALDWIIVGGESGRGARPMHPGWARMIRDQCATAGVPFFFKQWGEWEPLPADATVEPQQDAARKHAIAAWNRSEQRYRIILGSCVDHMQYGCAEGNEERSTYVRRVGKAAAGRLLDGVMHDAMPGRAA